MAIKACGALCATCFYQIGLTNLDEASDGNMALEKMRGKLFGLIISDWSMGTMTGLEFLKEVRAGVQSKAIPFILITAESKTENIIAATQAGMSDYIVKPFNADTPEDQAHKRPRPVLGRHEHGKFKQRHELLNKEMKKFVG